MPHIITISFDVKPPSVALMQALGIIPTGADPMLHRLQALPALRLSSDANVSEDDVFSIYEFFKREVEADKKRKERLYPGLELLIKTPPDNPNILGAGDSKRKADAFTAVQNLFKARSRIWVHERYDGKLNADEFRQLLRKEIKMLHVGSGVAAFDGEWDELEPSDWGRIGNRIRREYGFSDKLIQQIEDGELSLKQVLASMDRYGETASATYEAAKQAYVGINPALLRYHPGDGTTVCRSNCHCRWNIRVISKKRGDFNASWRLGSVQDHCKTCVERHRKWRTVKIRGGKITGEFPAITR